MNDETLRQSGAAAVPGVACCKNQVDEAGLIP